MTTHADVNVTCAVCGGVSLQRVIRSTNCFGPPDLDLRPAPMMRWTLENQVQQCPTCGACDTDLERCLAAAKKVVKENDYVALLTDVTWPPLARRFLCAAMIHERNLNLNKAFAMSIRAAWACDDAENDPSASDARRAAAKLLLRLRETGKRLADEPAGDEILLSDLYRRAGDFDAARKVLASAPPTTSELLQRCLEFEARFAK